MLTRRQMLIAIRGTKAFPDYRTVMAGLAASSPSPDATIDFGAAAKAG